MTLKTRKARSKSVMSVLQKYYERDGWHSSRRTEDTLYVEKKINLAVVHAVQINQPLPPLSLPKNDQFGFRVTANVSFVDLEYTINSIIGRDQSYSGSLTASFPLGSLVPKGGFYLDNVFLAECNSDPYVVSQSILREYETYLVPILQKLSSVKILEDQSYFPPFVDTWFWNLRRAAYYIRKGERDVAIGYINRIDEEAKRFLTELGVKNDEERTKIFRTIASVAKNSDRRMAEHIIEAAKAFRESIREPSQKSVN